ncbi:hypothetical protein SESBI_29234 [Sesbania bispinosa]|nr:hypothetical protein SESBI_29234 [Sesbania bispinosa]
MKELVNIFQKNIVEDASYLLRNFSVTRNVGVYKPTKHMYKLIFQETAEVVVAESDLVTSSGLTPMTNWEIRNFKNQGTLCYTLADLIGVVTTISPKKDYGCSPDGYVFYRGKVEYMLFDEHIKAKLLFEIFMVRPGWCSTVHGPRMGALGMAYEDKPATIAGRGVEMPTRDDFLIINVRKSILDIQQS